MTEKRLEATLSARVFETRAEWEAAELKAGVVIFNGEGDHAHRLYLGMCCPCGCGRRDILPLYEGPNVSRAWGWNGDRAAPTLTPSIRLLEGEQAADTHWHGFLTNGAWVQA